MPRARCGTACAASRARPSPRRNTFNAITDLPTRISIIIPAYNRADLLPKTLDSALAQTRLPDEIIVVDDGSTDSTADVLAGYSAPVIVLRQPNWGRSAARNAGMAHSTGDLLMLLDSDDLLLPESIERLAGFLETNAAYDVAYSSAFVVDGTGATIG